MVGEQTNVIASSWEMIEIKKQENSKETTQISKGTDELLKSTKEAIDNPSFIKLLNESTFSSRYFSFGTNAEIYLGRWPLTYEATTTSIIRDYYETGKIFVHDNMIQHEQSQTIQVEGALNKKIEQSDDVKVFMQHILSNDKEHDATF